MDSPTLSQAIPGLLSKGELARAFGVTPRSIDRYVAQGLPCVTIGGKRVFLADAVAAWVRAQHVHDINPLVL
ncbi:MAG: helix-turn-helix domain-containing protein [Alphaproteobacteria bacterium]|nr:helix-turn-helix domain-containing protein [Alphaproteobacteria bacterium]